MLEHHFINWNQCKAGKAGVHASMFAVKNYGAPGCRRNELVALLHTHKTGILQQLLHPAWNACSERCWAYGSEQPHGWLGVMHMHFLAVLSPYGDFYIACMSVLNSHAQIHLLVSLDPAYKHVQALLTSVLDLSLPSNFSFVFDTDF